MKFSTFLLYYLQMTFKFLCFVNMNVIVSPCITRSCRNEPGTSKKQECVKCSFESICILIFKINLLSKKPFKIYQTPCWNFSNIWPKASISGISYSLESLGGLFQRFFIWKIHEYYIHLGSYYENCLSFTELKSIL